MSKVYLLLLKRNLYIEFLSLENDFTLGFGSSEQNHYNTESNRCFVLIDHSGYTTKSTANDATEYGDLLDAYENNDIANCAFYGNKNPSTQICWIGGQNVTYQEYEDFVNQKMGLGTYDPLGEATSTN